MVGVISRSGGTHGIVERLRPLRHQRAARPARDLGDGHADLLRRLRQHPDRRLDDAPGHRPPPDQPREARLHRRLDRRAGRLHRPDLHLGRLRGRPDRRRLLQSRPAASTPTRPSSPRSRTASTRSSPSSWASRSPCSAATSVRCCGPSAGHERAASCWPTAPSRWPTTRPTCSTPPHGRTTAGHQRLPADRDGDRRDAGGTAVHRRRAAIEPQRLRVRVQVAAGRCCRTPTALHALLWASLAGAVVALSLAVGQRILTVRQAMEALVEGFKSMLLALVVLVLAWSIGGVCTELHTADYLVGADRRTCSPRIWLPAAGLRPRGGDRLRHRLLLGHDGDPRCRWSSRSPTASSVAAGHAVGDPRPTRLVMIGTISSVLAGSVWGDHCSPISDTTILSSMASGCDHIAHVRTQIPYALGVGRPRHRDRRPPDRLRAQPLDLARRRRPGHRPGHPFSRLEGGGARRGLRLIVGPARLPLPPFG